MNSPLPCLILEQVEGAAPTRELAAGTMLDDKYRIERLLAVGGMGAVDVGTLLDRTGDSTLQMWVKHDALVDPYGAWIISDEDLNAGGGLGAVIYDANGSVRTLDVVTCTDPNSTPLMFGIESVPYPSDSAWHFLRITHTGGMVNICIDGRKVGDFAAPATTLTSTFTPHIGRNVRWTPQGAFFDGSIDDVRAFTTALACE